MNDRRREVSRCPWSLGSPEYIDYHDDEWGRPVTDETRLFEKICLEGFQSGLSWLTVLRKRDNFRSAFLGFDPAEVSRFDDRRVDRLLGDAGIIRHRGKIGSVINNARRLLAMHEAGESLADLTWSHADRRRVAAPTELAHLPAVTPASTSLSKELKSRGWTFVGPTTVYAMMQSVGVVNDHLASCHVRRPCESERRECLSRLRG